MAFGQIGLEIMAAMLSEAGHEVRGLVDRTYDPSPRVTSDEKRNLHALKKFKPDFVGFSVLTHRYQWCLKFAHMIKHELPDTKIIFGGPHPTAVPERVIAEGCVDIVCIGEGEYAMLELADDPGRTDINNLWFWQNGAIIRNPLRPLIGNLDELPFPMKELWLPAIDRSEFKRYLVMVSRGCPRACTYCFNSYLHELYRGLGRYTRFRSPDNVIEELKRAREKWEINWLLFMDDNLTLDPTWFREFAHLYSNHIGLPYACNIHPLDIDEERARLLKESNCRFAMVGLQSGSEKVRREITHRYETNDQVRQMARYCHEAGLNFSIDHIFGLDDTPEYLKESARLYNELRPFQVNPFFLYYFPKTPIIDIKGGCDIEQIENGTYQPPTIRSSRDPKYVSYRNLFDLMPLLPESLVRWLIETDRVNVLAHVPESVIWLARIITNLRGGNTPSIIAHLKFLPHLLLERIRGYRGGFD